jgi:hypothetical protein
MAKRKLALETEMPITEAVCVCTSIGEILLLNCLYFAVYVTEKYLGIRNRTQC